MDAWISVNIQWFSKVFKILPKLLNIAYRFLCDSAIAYFLVFFLYPYSGTLIPR